MSTFKKKDISEEKGEKKDKFAHCAPGEEYKMIEMEKGGKSGVFADLPTVLSNDASRQIFTEIAQLNGSAPSDLALASGIRPSVVSDLLKAMVENGLVEKDEEEEHNYGTAFAFHSLTPTGSRIAHEFKLTGKKHFGSSGFGKYQRE